MDSVIKAILSENCISDDAAILALASQIGTISISKYQILVAACKRSSIDAEEFFSSIYMKATEDVQYQMWKDGYVNSCPANKLIEDIISEDKTIIKAIERGLECDMPSSEAYFGGIQDVILGHIAKAKESLKIAMAWFTNPTIFRALLRACKRGIEVELLINNDLINNREDGLPFNELIGAGACLYIAEPPSLIHHKFCIIDDAIVIDGSYNWTILAERNNDENIVVLKNGNVIDTFVEAFDDLRDKHAMVSEMPNHVPQRREYDCCSYLYHNTEEWLEQAQKTSNKRQRRKLYKNIFKLVSEATAEELIPSDYYEVVKAEVEEERNRDTNLFRESVDRQIQQLQSQMERKEQSINSITSKVSALEVKKSAASTKYKERVARIESKRINDTAKRAQIAEVQKQYRAEQRKLNRSIKQHQETIEELRTETALLADKQECINSIQDTELEGGSGLCRINLKWETADDLDLHLILPNGTIDNDNSDVYYGHKAVEYNGAICSLDYDAIPNNANEHPQENIIWQNALPNGRYQVKVKLFNKKSGLENIPFFVTVFTKDFSKTEAFTFVNAQGKEVIDITDLIFKNGKVDTKKLFKAE